MTKDEARALRGQGVTLSAIADVAGVSATTVGRWCVGTTAPPGRGSRDTQARHRTAAAAARAAGRAEAGLMVGDPLWVSGTVLYWGEGTKERDLQLANTDQRAIRVFMRWVILHHRRNAEFVARLHLHPTHDEQAAVARWRSTLGDGVEFGATSWKAGGTGHRTNVHRFGVCSIRTRRSGLLLHRTLGWIDGLTATLESSDAGV